MNIAPFKTELFYEKYEFSTPYQLCNSDCETVSVGELLEMAGTNMAEFGELQLGYTESQENPELRKAIAAGYNQISADDVMVLGTPIEGIYLAARAILEPTDEVVVLTPAYDALINMFEHVVGPERVKKWAFRSTDAGWELDLADLEAAITPQTKMVVVNFPHNPTGFLPSPELLKNMAAIIEEHDIWLFYDEMYYGLVHSGTTPIMSAADATPKSIVLSGLSKTYGLPGLRTGWLIVQDEPMRRHLQNWKFYTSICPPAPSEFLAMAALKVRQQLRQKNIAQISHNLEEVQQFFDKWSDLFEWIPPMAGSTALVKVNVPSVTSLSEKVAAEAGVLLHPATTLGSDDHHMRIGLGRAGFAAALAKFDEYLDSAAIQTG